MRPRHKARTVLSHSPRSTIAHFTPCPMSASAAASAGVTLAGAAPGAPPTTTPGSATATGLGDNKIRVVTLAELLCETLSLRKRRVKQSQGNAQKR
jgi:hypothetical protein